MAANLDAPHAGVGHEHIRDGGDDDVSAAWQDGARSGELQEDLGREELATRRHARHAAVRPTAGLVWAHVAAVHDAITVIVEIGAPIVVCIAIAIFRLEWAHVDGIDCSVSVGISFLGDGLRLRPRRCGLRIDPRFANRDVSARRREQNQHDMRREGHHV